MSAAPLHEDAHEDAREDAHEDAARAVARSSVALVVSRVVVAALGWAGSVVIARHLSPDAWGHFSFVFGLLGLLGIITDLGVGRVVIARLLVADASEVAAVASSFVGLRVVLGFLGYLVALVVVVLGGYPPDVVQATALGGLVVVVATPSHALTVLFQSRLRLTVVAVTQVAGQVVQLALTVLAALVAPLLLVFVLPAVVNEVVQLVLKLRSVRAGAAGPVRSWPVEWRRWRGMLAEALPLTVGAALFDLVNRVDVVVLSRLADFEAVGLYSIGYRFADALGLLAFAVVGPVTTLLVAAWPDDVAAFRVRARTAALVLALLGALAVGGFWVAAEPLLTGLYGERFGAAVLSSQLLVVGGALGCLSHLAFLLLAAAGRHRLYPWVGALGLALNLALNVWLVPQHSYRGAAVATVVTEGVVLVLMWGVARKDTGVAGLVPAWQLAGLAVATAAGVLVGAQVVALSGVAGLWPVAVLAVTAVVLAGAWLLHYPGVRDWRRLPDLLRGRADA